MSDAVPVRRSCPRCVLLSKSNRGHWCDWELELLQQLMSVDEPPTMRTLMRVHFIGRSEASIDHACRRYGLKIPSRRDRVRRKRCGGCNSLYDGHGIVCAECAGGNSRVGA